MLNFQSNLAKLLSVMQACQTFMAIQQGKRQNQNILLHGWLAECPV